MSFQRRASVENITNLPRDVLDQMDELYNQCVNLGRRAKASSDFYRKINNVGDFTTTIGNVVVAMNTFSNAFNFGGYFAIVPFTLSIISGSLMYFSPEKKATQLLHIDMRARAIAREIRRMRTVQISKEKALIRIETFAAEIDDMELSMFDETAATGKGSARGNFVAHSGDDKSDEKENSELEKEISQKIDIKVVEPSVTSLASVVPPGKKEATVYIPPLKIPDNMEMSKNNK